MDLSLLKTERSVILMVKLKFRSLSPMCCLWRPMRGHLVKRSWRGQVMQTHLDLLASDLQPAEVQGQATSVVGSQPQPQPPVSTVLSTPALTRASSTPTPSETSDSSQSSSVKPSTA